MFIWQILKYHMFPMAFGRISQYVVKIFNIDLWNCLIAWDNSLFPQM